MRGMEHRGMARYRVGNRYLSEKEYQEEVDTKWAGGLFLFGLITVGIIVNKYLVDPEWHKTVRFFATAILAIVSGIILALIRNIIIFMIGLLFAASALMWIYEIVMALI